ncbi:MAG TPA: type IVB secretion system protein IcmV [Gammaproteobacteria bacterium]|nr:type IVB secretion system protein IcmV [Gammaproteobacteria bacterium]
MFKFIGRRIVKTGQTFGRWADVPLLKRMLSFMHHIGMSIFKNRKNEEPNETFEEAVKRLKLSEADLIVRARLFKIQILLYGFATLGVAIYLAYLVAGGHWLSAAINLFIMMLLLVCTLRSHFWLFQIKQRKLGCTLDEWLNSSIKESK